MSRIYFRTVLVGFLTSAIGVLVAWLLLPLGAMDASIMCAPDGFARRWDGSCAGWTEGLAVKHLVGDLLHWWAYTTMAVVIAWHHPILKGDWKSWVTVNLTSIFIFGCGLTHLIEAYTVFNPMYIAQAGFKIANGVVSVAAMFFVIHGLLRSVALYEKRLAELEKHRK